MVGNLVLASLVTQGLALACLSLYCPNAWVSAIQISNTLCDPACMSAHCGFDASVALPSPCLAQCGSHCDLALLGNGECDPGKN